VPVSGDNSGDCGTGSGETATGAVGTAAGSGAEADGDKATGAAGCFRANRKITTSRIIAEDEASSAVKRLGDFADGFGMEDEGVLGAIVTALTAASTGAEGGVGARTGVAGTRALTSDSGVGDAALLVASKEGPEELAGGVW